MSLPGLPRDDDGRLSQYAFPGGYPLYYYDKQHSVLCPACARKSDEDADELEGFRPAFVGINYEDADCYCQQCSERIPSAYAEDSRNEPHITEGENEE